MLTVLTVDQVRDLIAYREFTINYTNPDTYYYQSRGEAGKAASRRVSGWDHWIGNELKNIEVDGLGVVSFVEQGYDNDGDLVAVFKVEADGVTRVFGKGGYSNSYDGDYWDGAFFEAVKATKTVEYWKQAE